MTEFAVTPLGLRVANAVVSYAAYLGKTVWPADLMLPYLFPLQGHAPWKVAGSSAVLVCVTWTVVRCRRSRPAAMTGWFWYLGTLVPVIGLVQVGIQAMADRYTYVPLIGIFLGLIWVVGDMASRWRRLRWPGILAVCAVVAGLAATARVQVGYWRDGATLTRHTRSVANDWSAYLAAGEAYESHGRLAEAEEAYRSALEIKPDLAVAHNNLGGLLFLAGRREEAVEQLRAATRAQPDSAEALYNLGYILVGVGRPEEAVAALSNAVRLKPDHAKARDLLRQLGRD